MYLDYPTFNVYPSQSFKKKLEGLIAIMFQGKILYSSHRQIGVFKKQPIVEALLGSLELLYFTFYFDLI